MKHQFQLYVDMLKALVRLQSSKAVDDGIDVYASVVQYYILVLLMFCREVKESTSAPGSKWRSAHLDFHFVMAFEGNSFTEAQQDVALQKLRLTRQDFQGKKRKSNIECERSLLTT